MKSMTVSLESIEDFVTFNPYPPKRYCLNCPGKTLSMHNPHDICWACQQEKLNRKFRDAAIPRNSRDHKATRLSL